MGKPKPDIRGSRLQAGALAGGADLADLEVFDPASSNRKVKGPRPRVPTLRRRLHLDDRSRRILLLDHVNMHLYPKRFSLRPRPNSLRPVGGRTTGERSVAGEQTQESLTPSRIDRLDGPPNKRCMKRRKLHDEIPPCGYWRGGTFLLNIM